MQVKRTTRTGKVPSASVGKPIPAFRNGSGGRPAQRRSLPWSVSKSSQPRKRIGGQGLPTNANGVCCLGLPKTCRWGQRLPSYPPSVGAEVLSMWPRCSQKAPGPLHFRPMRTESPSTSGGRCAPAQALLIRHLRPADRQSPSWWCLRTPSSASRRCQTFAGTSPSRPRPGFWERG